MVKEGKAIVVDPTVVYEKNQAILKANEAKVTKYRHLADTIERKFQVGEVIFKGLAIGARGGWHSANDQTLKLLGIKDQGFAAHLCRFTLKGTTNLCRLFMDG